MLGGPATLGAGSLGKDGSPAPLRDAVANDVGMRGTRNEYLASLIISLAK